MFCHRCGAQLNDGAHFCFACGAQQPQQSSPEYSEGSAPQQPPQYAQPPSEQVNSQIDPQPQQQQYPLGWHKFLIYFSLWAGGVINLLSAIRVLTGFMYQWDGYSMAYRVYSMYPGLKTLDYLYGMALIVIGGFFIFVRFQLAAFRRGAPKFLIGLYAVGTAVSVIYSVAASAIVGINMIDAGSIGSLSGSMTMIIINYIYYRNRASLFVN